MDGPVCDGTEVDGPPGVPAPGWDGLVTPVDVVVVAGLVVVVAGGVVLVVAVLGAVPAGAVLAGPVLGGAVVVGVVLVVAVVTAGEVVGAGAGDDGDVPTFGLAGAVGLLPAIDTFALGELAGPLVVTDGELPGPLVATDGELAGPLVVTDGELAGPLAVTDGELAGPLAVTDGELIGPLVATDGVPTGPPELPVFAANATGPFDAVLFDGPVPTEVGDGDDVDTLGPVLAGASTAGVTPDRVTPLDEEELTSGEGVLVDADT